ncbi:rRNA methyltransferase 2, mitochondrial [Onthophagus taurus]|uniref:rRNA methyltransferase 2, mitochondrial n=1 Tax=Onthophagus taurus TaxID=166361 RepID=UPI000C20C3F9|nr:rRNA methyltransferase 2, mitochondrial [Onthophagus taurus]
MFKKYVRFISTTLIKQKVVPNNLKGKKVSSQQWLTRQLNDPYVEKAKMMNYRCRSAFKLIEMNDKYNFLQPKNIVIDCGASPGSWTQVAIHKVKLKNEGVVIAIDKQQIYPIEGAIIFGNSDFTNAETQGNILKILQGEKVDVVLSDMAPSATGIKEMDDENILKLCYSVLRFAIINGKKGGTILVKMWQCGESKQFESDLLKFYDNVKIIKPKSSRKDSSEIYFLGRGFKGVLNQ